jgi:GGDEF domain-containing protein
MGDNFGMSVIKDNDKLKNNVTYAINLGRDKLQHNIEEHKKTKEQFQLCRLKDKQIINDLKEELSNIGNLKEKPKQANKSNKDNVLDKVEVANYDINEKKYFKKSYEEILTNELNNIKDKNETFTLVKLTIDRFDKLQHQFSTENINPLNIIKGLYRFFLTSLSNKDIVYYSHSNIYYIIFKELSIEKVKSYIKKINVTKEIGILTISFSISATRYKENDTFESINDRCDIAHQDAKKTTDKGSIIFN